jgi:hypothetical protein
VESTRRTRPSAPIVICAVKRPGTLNATMLAPASPGRAPAFARSAALSAPCGVIQSWWMRSLTKRGPGVAVEPAWFQAISPLTNWSLRCWPLSG